MFQFLLFVLLVATDSTTNVISGKTVTEAAHVSSTTTGTVDKAAADVVESKSLHHDDDENDDTERQILNQIMSLSSSESIPSSSTTEGSSNDDSGGGFVWNHLSITTGCTHGSIDDDDDDDDNSATTTTTTILHDTSGIIPHGEMMGMIGPSGSGKTSLLQAFVQRSIHTVHGTMYKYNYQEHQQQQGMNEKNRHDHCKSDRCNTSSCGSNRTVVLHVIPSKQMAYLTQTDHDAFFTQLTVWETLQLSFFLEQQHQSPPTTNTDESSSSSSSSSSWMKDRNIQQTIQQLGLQHVMNRTIGSSSSSSTSSSSSAISSNRRYTVKSILSSFLPKRKIRRLFSVRSQRRNSTTTTATTTDTISSGATSTTIGIGRLSGGERRRLSVAVELLSHDKLVLLADEPTSGLDSRYAIVVMKLLHAITQQRKLSTIVSLHQPPSQVWDLFHSILLIAPGGYVCYCGRRDEMMEYFRNIGYDVPLYTNPSEYYIDLVSINYDNNTQAQIDQERIQYLYQSFKSHQQHQQLQHNTATSSSTASIVSYQSIASNNNNVASATSTTTDPSKSQRRRHAWKNVYHCVQQLPFIRSIRRIMALFLRSWRQNIRDVAMNRSRFFISVGNAIVLAGVFPSIKRNQVPLINSIADRVALLSFGAINLCMMAYMKTITLFAQEHPIVHRELNLRQHYTSLEYLIAKVTSELPIDMIFSFVFAIILKYATGLQITLPKLSQVFASLTAAGASLGFLLGSTASSYQYAVTSGIPVLVILMVVGVINPSGVDPTKPKPVLLQCLKQISPFAYAIEALCVGEYRGVQFYASEITSSNGKPIRGRIGSFVARLKDAPRMGGLAMITTGDEVLNALGMKDQTYNAAMKHLAWISFGNLVCSWLGLLWKERQQRRSYSNNNGKNGSTGNQPKPPQSSLSVQSKSSDNRSSSKPNQNVTLRVPINPRV